MPYLIECEGLTDSEPHSDEFEGEVEVEVLMRSSCTNEVVNVHVFHIIGTNEFSICCKNSKITDFSLVLPIRQVIFSRVHATL